MYTKQLHSCRNMKTMVSNIFLVLPVIFFWGILEVESAVEGGCGWNVNCSSPIRGRYIPPATPPKYVGNPYVIEAEGPQRIWWGNRTNATIAGRAALPGGFRTFKSSPVKEIAKDLVSAGGKVTVGSQGETMGGAVDLGPVASGSAFALHIPGFIIPVAGAVSGDSGALSGEPGRITGDAASLADKLSKLPCKSLNGPAGPSIQAGNSDGKVTKQVTTDNLNDAGLPRPIIKEIVEILETMVTQDYYNNGKTYFSEKTIIEFAKNGEVPKLPVGKPETSILNKTILVDLDYDRVLDAFPKCLPRLPKTKRRKRYVTEIGEKDDATKLSENNQDAEKIRGKRETVDDLLKQKKKCRLVLKVKPRTPFCDDFFKKHPEDKDKPESQIKDPGTAAGESGATDLVPHTKVTFKIEVMKDTEDKYFIKVSVTDVNKSEKKTTIYQKGDEYFITMKKKQADAGLPGFLFYIYKVLAAAAEATGDASALKALEEKMNFKNLVSIIWWKVNADTFCIKDIFLTPIEGANSICGDLPYVYNYLKQLEEQKSPDKMASLLLEFDSGPFTRLFSLGSIFSFSDWYRVFQNVYAGGNYQGNRFQVKEEWVDNEGDYAKIQNITITWGKQNNIAKVDIATLKSGEPKVWRQEFNPDGTTFNPLCQKKKTAPQSYPM